MVELVETGIRAPDTSGFDVQPAESTLRKPLNSVGRACRDHVHHL